jgi:hypothetical protein
VRGLRDDAVRGVRARMEDKRIEDRRRCIDVDRIRCVMGA